MSDAKAADATSSSYPSSTKSAGALEDARAELDQFDPELVKRTWRKVDWAILPIAVILYLAAYIDRANIGNAKVLGLATSLKLTSSQYNWALSIFFIGYVIFETPSNILLRKISPRWYIPTLTVLWGLVCVLFATVKSAKGLLAIRFFLGVAEAGFLPGIVYWLSCWYPRTLLGRRYAVLYSTVSLTGAFGGLLATAIHSLDGTYGIAGWKAASQADSASSPSSSCPPTQAPRASSPPEKHVVLLANEADRGQRADERFRGAQVRAAFADWRTWLWGLVYIAIYIPVYSVILSLPSVVTGLGYAGTHATLMACPPYGLGFVIVLLAGWTTDRYGRLFCHFVGAIVVVMVALVVLMAVENLVVRYVMFFFVMFMFIPVSVCWTWLGSNVTSATKRAAALGVVFSLGNIGGTVSGQIYRAEWAPRYVQGHAINIGCYAIALVAGGALWWSYKTDNERRDGAANETVKKTKQHDLLGEDLGDLGDRHPSFRYYL
ncbi:MFS general substrate transporter [Ganoderma sinense ZZ0214-1]|uniref:MFS general substrate transporter n=1 Tax=Ganoderma sinense ZZ0214-1 TaxID=1077348 RepID=A0A2G8SFH8_9APHY|nr:MFS general substrate transporter [Ganoderma sinense ZZ0214-1]